MKDTESEVSKRYASALKNVMHHGYVFLFFFGFACGCKLLIVLRQDEDGINVASLNDQVVLVRSFLFYSLVSVFSSAIKYTRIVYHCGPPADITRFVHRRNAYQCVFSHVLSCSGKYFADIKF